MNTALSTCRKIFTSILTALAAVSLHSTEYIPPAGSVWKEQILVNQGRDWRVTQSTATRKGTEEFLPNPILAFQDVSLENATRADLVIDFWSGHEGTIEKRFRFNGKDWIPVPEKLHGVDHHPREYMAQYTLVVDVPIDQLRSGENLLEGDAGPNHWKNAWGQWGWFSVNLRVFYESNSQPTAKAQLSLAEGSQLSENPTLSIVSSGEVATQEVRIFGNYNGVDTRGQGDPSAWHVMQQDGLPSGHIATLLEGETTAIWNTQWVPDQSAPFSLQVMVQGENGYWTSMPPIEELTLVRDASVALYEPDLQPTVFWTRAHKPSSCIINLPTPFDPDQVEEATLFIRSWNPKGNEENHTPFRVNSSPWYNSFTGPAHKFDQDYFSIPVDQLQPGPNLISFLGSTHHHGAEILRPGPTLLLRSRSKPAFFAWNENFGRSAPISILPDVIDEEQPSLKVETESATYYYHMEGGGFSSMIDKDGKDWLSYSTAKGVSGEFRGIPNMVFRGKRGGFFHPGHSGSKASNTNWNLQPDGSIRIDSTSIDNQRSVRWEVHDKYATLEIIKTHPVDPGYWFLYEGTPGGVFDTENSRWIRSDGTTGPLSEKWEKSLADNAWVAVTNPEQTRSLVIWRETQEPQSVDSYFPLHEMTVLGFGRASRSIENLMTSEGQRFLITFLDTVDPKEIQQAIDEFTR
ncbi:hypothetical protein [Pelagicoccus mobilis]|uniref:Uncharacterized protein n=1 Tax=Pelagicoccus mobilis TaxID=415221 RepID=A0A934VPG4_9BACT|nr:hypothetical protein [Pelagicoccus mobilis]MBK1875509.1 hypothetical protein [Pelagicoccus mobilis]